jgi:hypothetical protein
MACYRLAEQPEISLLGKLKCLAQANSMARQAHSGLRLLQRMQVARQKTEETPKPATAPPGPSTAPST